MGRKIAVIAIAVVVVIVAGIGVFVVTQLDRRVAEAVETYGAAATGTSVDVGGVDVSLTEGSGRLRRLTIGNPEGFSSDYALRIEGIDLEVDLSSLAGEVPVIREIVVDDAHLNAEQRGRSTNLTDIQRYMSDSGGAAEPAAGAEEGRIIIDRFRLTNARVTVASELSDDSEVLELDDVVVEDVGRAAGGATYSEATEAVLGPILAAARSAVEGRLRDAASDAAREEIEEETEERLRDLLDRD